MTALFDTTLRDGEHMPSVRFTPAQKLELATEISDFGAAVIETMPIVPGEEETTRLLIQAGLRAEIRALARLRTGDIDAAARSGAKRVLLVSSVSDIHLQHKLGWTREENIRRALESIDYCHGLGLRVDYAAEDATRADREYLLDFAKVVAPSIDYLLIGDSLGCCLPTKTAELFGQLKKELGCKLEAHCHNDFGLATANTLAAISAGADAFTATFCGIGERAGNAATEEVCLALEKLHNTPTGLKLDRIKPICDSVRLAAGIALSPHKPWVGENAFTHKAGTHVAAVQRHPRTYEYFDPAEIGQRRRFANKGGD